MKTFKFLLALLTFAFFLLTFSLTFSSEAYATHATCSSVPISGSYTLPVSTTCAFGQAVDGVDGSTLTTGTDTTNNANLTLSSTSTLQVGGPAGATDLTSQVVVWGGTISIPTGGSIAIRNGASLRQAPLWLPSADADKYPDTTTMSTSCSLTAGCYSSTTPVVTGTTFYRRYYMTGSGTNTVTNTSEMTADCSSTATGTCPAASSTGFSATAASATQIDLAWTASTDTSTTGYKVFRCAGSGCTPVDVSITVTPGTATSYSNTGLTCGTLYRYYLKATNSAGDSPASTIAEATTSSCGLANGAVCTVGSDCASGNCYVDADNDTYAPATGTKTCRASAQTAGTDCNDADATKWQNLTAYTDADLDSYGAPAGVAGPRSPASAQNIDNGPSNPAWVNPTNVFTSNDIKANSGFGANELITDTLEATNFGFTIPTDATINGIRVAVEERRPNEIKSVSDALVVLVLPGGTTSTSKGKGIYWPFAGDQYEEYGGLTDLWGLTVTPANINDASFGVRVRAQGEDSQAGQPVIDHITVTVYYTPASGAPTQCSGSSPPSGYSSNANDCYDSNANAKPGQTSYFSTNRGDGSFDYNCDFGLTKTYDSTQGSDCGGAYAVLLHANAAIRASYACGWTTAWCTGGGGASTIYYSDEFGECTQCCRSQCLSPSTIGRPCL